MNARKTKESQSTMNLCSIQSRAGRWIRLERTNRVSSGFESAQSDIGALDYRAFLTRNLPGASLNLDAPDESWLLVDRNRILAHFSLWYETEREIDGIRYGVIGHFFASEEATGTSALHKACEILSEHDIQCAIGPMDGSTWRKYRLVSEGSEIPPFLGEPKHPLELPRYFHTAGFTTLAKYSSSIVDLDQCMDSRASEIDKSMQSEGLSIRPIQMERFDEELRDLFEVSSIAFRNNFLYSPISCDEFVNRYSSLRAAIDPDLIIIAERQNNIVGFIFAVPLDHQKVMIKTLGRRPDSKLKGIGRVLVSRCHRMASKKGYKQAIHALYKDDNRSRSFSREARVIRRYELLWKNTSDSARTIFDTSVADSEINR